MAPERLVNVQEMARILGVPPSWIYQRTQHGQGAIPFVKLGKYVRFDPQQVIAFFEAKGTGGSGGTNGVS